MSARVLIADDEEAILTSLEFLLSRAGHITRGTRDGIDAVKVADQFRPDLIVLDLMLPGMSGLDVCRNLRTNPMHASLKILMLSARGTVKDLAEGDVAGVDAYHVKPFSTKELMAVVSRLLDPSGVHDVR